MKTKLITFFLFSLISFNPIVTLPVQAQVKFSLATDVSLLHNFVGKQSFTVFGQSIHGQWHLDIKNTLYTWFSYHSNGKNRNSLMASAKSISTQPQSILFTNNSELKLRQFSTGIKRYLLGGYNNLEKFNLYGAAGFGIIIGTASNTFSAHIDTALYTVQNNILSGSGDFKRMSLDLTAGWELPLAYEIFVFSEARIHIPTTGYPNNYLLKNSNAPFPGSINFGFRILFNNDQ